MTIDDKTVLVTGASRGIGPALVRGLDIPKASAESVARAILDGVPGGEEDIFPDPLSEPMADGWRTGAGKAPERRFAALLQAEPVTS